MNCSKERPPICRGVFRTPFCQKLEPLCSRSTPANTEDVHGAMNVSSILIVNASKHTALLAGIGSVDSWGKGSITKATAPIPTLVDFVKVEDSQPVVRFGQATTSTLLNIGRKLALVLFTSYTICVNLK